MALAAGTQWEVQSAGSDTNGGGFDPTNVNMATDLAGTSATGVNPVCSSASYNFVAADVGYWLYVKSGGTWFPGWYKILSVASNAATVDATTGNWIDATTNLPSTKQGAASSATPATGVWSVDYSQNPAARIAFTDMVIDATTNTKFTSVLKPVGKNFIGNIINVTGGTGFTVQRVQISSTVTTTATCDKSLGTLGSTGGTGNLGGALASLGQVGGLLVGNNKVWQKSDAGYSITSATINISGGCFAPTVVYSLEGYATVRGDMGAKPVNTASGISTAVIIATTSTSDAFIFNIKVDGASLTSIQGFNLLARGFAYASVAANCTNSGFNGAAGSVCVSCLAAGCATAGAGFNNVVECFGCESYSNTVPGFIGNLSGTTYSRCLSYNNSGASSDGFQTSSNEILYTNCVAYNNGRDGFRCASGTGMICVNCLSEANAGWNYERTNLSGLVLIDCGGFVSGGSGNVTSNTSGVAETRTVNYNFITGTGTFFTSASTGDFSLNNNPGAGAAARAGGMPGVFPRGTTTGFLDAGAAQHPDTGGSSLVYGGGVVVP